MGKFKFELNRKGVRELMNSQEMINVLTSYAYKARNKTGSPENFDVTYQKGKTRANAMIAANSKKGRRLVYRRNVLLKALNDSRGD